MKTKVSFVLIAIAALFSSGINKLHGQTTYSQENFPNHFNESESAPVNSIFQGRIGTWTAQSTDANSTIAVKSDPGVSSTDLKFIINANGLGTISQNTATSPLVDLSWITCTSKFDFFFQLYTSNVSLGNTGTTLLLQFYNGSTWNTYWSSTASQLYSTYGQNAWTDIGLVIPNSFMGMSNFQYRFITQNAAGNLVSTNLYIDNPRVVNYSCDATASVGNWVWNDANENGIQDSGENGMGGVQVKLAKAPGDTLVTTTDATGYYLFSSLPPAGYKVIFPAISGFAVTSSNTCSDDYDSDIDALNKEVVVFLSANESNMSIDAGYKVSVVLPVKLMNFYGNRKENRVVLNWTVSENVTAGRFYVEKSDDGTNFSTAGLVLAGEQSGISDYVFNDIHATGKVFYRLKMVDKNEKKEYSKVLVFAGSKFSEREIRIIGNPVSDKLTLSYEAAINQKSILQIFDMNGRLQFTQSVNSLAGSNIISIPVTSGLSKGLYIVSLTSGNEIFKTKFIKQ